MFNQFCQACGHPMRICHCGMPVGFGTRVARAVPRWAETPDCGCRHLQAEWDALGFYGVISSLPEIRAVLVTNLTKWVRIRPIAALIVWIWVGREIRRYRAEWEAWVSDKKLSKSQNR